MHQMNQKYFAFIEKESLAYPHSRHYGTFGKAYMYLEYWKQKGLNETSIMTNIYTKYFLFWEKRIPFNLIMEGYI